MAKIEFQVPGSKFQVMLNLGIWNSEYFHFTFLCFKQAF